MTRYEPILAACSGLSVPLYVHPDLPLPAVQAPYYGGFERELGARLAMFAWEWHNEAGIQVLRLLLSGVFDRHPMLQVISGHWGEMVPFFLQRLEDSMPQEASGLERPIVQTYREHVYVSPSGMLTLSHFQFIHALMGAERILYSIDYPYQSLDGTRAFVERLPVSDAEKALITHGDAERLLNVRYRDSALSILDLRRREKSLRRACTTCLEHACWAQAEPWLSRRRPVCQLREQSIQGLE